MIWQPDMWTAMRSFNGAVNLKTGKNRLPGLHRFAEILSDLHVLVHCFAART
jgi:hypothetical protein